MLCPYCGHEFTNSQREESTYCPECKTKIESDVMTMRNVIDEFSEEFDPEMIESRDSRSGRAIMAENIDEAFNWLGSRNLNVTVNFGVEYEDGDVSGTPVAFVIPKDAQLFDCQDCRETWVGPYDREAMNEGEKVGPEEHEFRTEHKVDGL